MRTFEIVVVDRADRVIRRTIAQVLQRAQAMRQAAQLMASTAGAARYLVEEV